jgi:competence protein ComEC
MIRANIADVPRLQREGAGMLTSIVTWAQVAESRPRLELKDVAFKRCGRRIALKRARVRLGNGVRPAVGDRIEVRAVMRPPPPPAAPGAYDFQRRAFFKGIGGVGFAIGAVVIVEKADNVPWFNRARALFRDQIYRALPDLPDLVGITAALTVGDRSGVTEVDDDALRASGLAHLLAISSLHLGMAAGVVYLSLRLLFALPHGSALRFPVHKFADIGGIVAAIFYLGLSGAAPPAQRAFVMVIAAMVAILTDRLRSGLWFVAWGAVAVVIVSPHEVAGPSFQLSFSAATGIVAAYEVIALRRRTQEEPAFAQLGKCGRRQIMLAASWAPL